MTTIEEATKECAVCGNVSDHIEVISTKALGSSDLDARPPEPERSTIAYWIQRCPSCGYCAPDIAKGDKEMSNIIESDMYKQQLRDTRFPELANSFLCWSMIQEEVAQYKIAGWTSVKAAWACDDEQNDDAARVCRDRAIILLDTARKKGQWFAGNAGTEEAVIVDLLRRSGQLDAALRMCKERLEKDPEEFIHDVLVYQIKLIEKSDVARHVTAEITSEIR
jgi:uncharacterized protein (DUF2225 family)